MRTQETITVVDIIQNQALVSIQTQETITVVDIIPHQALVSMRTQETVFLVIIVESSSVCLRDSTVSTAHLIIIVLL